MRDDAGRLCGRDRRVAVAVHGLALEALKRSVPDARGEGDAVQIGKGDLEGVGRDVAEHSVPQGRDLAGVLLDDVAQVDHGGRGLLCDPDGLLREEDGLIGRGLRREGDGLVVFVVLLGTENARRRGGICHSRPARIQLYPPIPLPGDTKERRPFLRRFPCTQPGYLSIKIRQRGRQEKTFSIPTARWKKYATLEPGSDPFNFNRQI